MSELSEFVTMPNADERIELRRVQRAEGWCIINGHVVNIALIETFCDEKEGTCIHLCGGGIIRDSRDINTFIRREILREE